MHVVLIIAFNADVHYFNEFAAIHIQNNCPFQLTFVHLCDDRPTANYPNNNPDVHWIKYPYHSRKKKLYSVYRQTKALLKKLNPDIIHTNLFEDALICHYAAKKLNIKGRIHTKQCTGFHWNYAKKGVKFDRKINQWATDLIAISSENKTFLIEKELAPEGKISFIPHGVSFDTTTRSTPEDRAEFRRKYNLEDKFVIGTVSRYIEWKRYFDMIHAIEILRKKIPNILLLCVGGGEQEQELADYIKSKNLENHIILVGRIEKRIIPTAYQCLDIYLHGSYMEPFGFVIPEAAGNGVPIVSTPTGSALDLIEHKNNGWLANYYDPDSLAEGVLFMMSNDAELMAKRAKEKAEKLFSIQTMWDNYVKLYTEIMSR